MYSVNSRVSILHYSPTSQQKTHYTANACTSWIIPGAAVVVISHLVEKVAILLLKAATTKHHEQYFTPQHLHHTTSTSGKEWECEVFVLLGHENTGSSYAIINRDMLVFLSECCLPPLCYATPKTNFTATTSMY